jgi:hypothetical protein
MSRARAGGRPLSRRLGHTGRMKNCCAIGNEYAASQRRVLHVVLWINAAMFVGEFAAGLFALSAIRAGIAPHVKAWSPGS